MSIAEFIDHYRDYQTAPFGADIDTFRHAELCSILVNGFYHPKEPIGIDEFMPKLQPKKPQSIDDQKRILRGLIGG